MYTVLGREALKTGEQMEVGVALTPDEEWRDQIIPFLGHKGAAYSAHIRRSLEGPLDNLQTRHYLGSVEGRVITHVMIVGDRGAGILGHVYTLPEERRKGAYGKLMAHQMRNVAEEGFKVINLGTGFESPPYWIYHSYGFRSIGTGRGQMTWLAHPEAERELMSPAPTRIRPLEWGDWGYMDLLAAQPPTEDEELPRCRVMGLKDYGSLEGPYVAFTIRREDDGRIQANALVAETGATVGWAILAPDNHWWGDAWAVDLHAHPNFHQDYGRLVASLEWPDVPTVAYASEPRGLKATALEAAGFRPTGTVDQVMSTETGRRSVTIWQRNAD